MKEILNKIYKTLMILILFVVLIGGGILLKILLH